MNFSLEDKVVIVTGGTGLLGKEFVEGILKNSGTVIIAEIDEEKGLLIESKLKDKFGPNKVLFQKVDITSKTSILRMMQIVKEKYNKIDCLVNNAFPKNSNFGKHFFDVDYEDFCEHVNHHLGGYFLASQQFAKFFKEQGWGNIINISSIYGFMAPRFEIYNKTDMTTPVEYAATKSAIIQLTKYMAKYLKGSGIRVNCISPGGIFNNQSIAFVSEYNANGLEKGLLDSKDIVGTLLFLLSDISQYINGQNIVVDDGFSL